MESEYTAEGDTGQKYLLAAYLTIIIIIIGVLGNLLTIVALSTYPRIRNVTAAFIISLCVADGLFCAVVLPFNAARFFHGTWTHGQLFCKLVPFLQYGNVGLSLLFIAMITINRYVMIAHYNLYNRIYKPTIIAAMIVFCLLLSFGMQLPTLFGVWGEFKFDTKLNTCSITEDKWGRSSKTTLFVTGFVVPCIVIIVCYTRIFWVVHSSEVRLRKHSTRPRPGANTLARDGGETKRKRNEWRITKMVLAIFLSFLICYLPITIVKVADNQVNYIALHVISYLMLYASACVNPIIYVIVNKQYRKAYKNVVTCSTSAFFNWSSTARSREADASKTVMSQVSIGMVTMNTNGIQHTNEN